MRPTPVDLTLLPLADVAAACRDETGKFLRRVASDDAFCLELFRRAVCERLDSAWEALIAQYRGMVLSWVRQHPVARSLQEGDDFWINRAFERFWHAVGPDRFGAFGGLPALLKYLKLCVHSVLVDEARARSPLASDPLDDLPEGTDQDQLARRHVVDAEEQAITHLAGGDLWRAIDAELADETERLVTYLSFVRDLKPREIYEQHRGRIRSITSVYRIKRNVIERLRRSAQIRSFGS